MNSKYLLKIGCAVAVILVGASVGCSHTPKKYPLQGQVIAKNVSLGQVTVTHAAIPNLMPAMTATFAVDDLAVLQNLQPGDKISGQLVESQNPDGYRLEAVHITETTGLGKTLYHDNCAECHDNPQPDLHKQPPDLHGLFQKKSLPSGAALTDERLHQVIIEGVGTMPAFDQRLNDRDVDALVRYLHDLN